jgi:hypothetical protein
MASLQEFKLLNPKDYNGEMLVYIDDYNVVKAVNISNLDRNSSDIRKSLINFQSVTTTILGYEMTITPTSAVYMGGYWHFEVTNFNLLDNATETLFTGSFIPSETQPIYVESAVFNPLPNNFDFRKSEYEVLENNSELNRTTNLIFAVDRQKDSINPTNIQAILSGSATEASFQESNHTVEGILSSRYKGTKTSITDFGINSALNAKAIQAEIYISSSTTDLICSQSDNLRNIETVLFSSPETVPLLESSLYGIYPTSGSRIFNLVSNQVIPIRDRKVWIQDTRTIVYLDKNGYAISSGTVCT